MSILIDIGASECFISPRLLSRFMKRSNFMAKPWTIKYANQSRAKVEQCLFEAQVDFPNFSTELNLYVAPLGSYNIIIGINWVSKHRAKVDCLAKMVHCVDDQGRPTSISRIKYEIRAKKILQCNLRDMGGKVVKFM